VLNQYQRKTDEPSGIVNDPNDWASEHDQPTYIFDLLRRVVTVSMRTLDLVDSLPAFDLG
jgi:predicted helicase